VKTLTPLERVSKKIDATGFCWLWRGALQDGYGSQIIDGKSWAAHRLVYTLLVGEVPTGLDLDHLCRVRHCVNPDHLEPVTRGENLRRSHNIGKGDPWKHRRHLIVPMSKRTTCPQGHSIAEVGVYTCISRGKAVESCDACRRIAACKHNHLKKGCPPVCNIRLYPRLDMPNP